MVRNQKVSALLKRECVTLLLIIWLFTNIEHLETIMVHGES